MLSPRHRLASAILVALGAAAMLTSSFGCAPKETLPEYIPFPSLQQVGLRQVWERQIVLAPKESIEHVWRVGDSVYVATNQSRLARIDAASGVKEWDVSVGGGSEFHRPTEIAGGKRLIVANRGELLMLNKGTGRTEASSRLDFLMTTDPIVIGDNLCVGGNDYFYGLFLDQLGGRSWVTVASGDGFTAQPAVVADSLILASTQGKLWRVSAVDGDWLWKDRKTNGEVVAPLATDAKAVYVPCLDHQLYAFDLANGSELWDSRLEGTLDQKPLTLKGQILVPSSGKGLYAVTSSNGHVKWEADGISQIAAVVGDQVWAGDTSGNLKALSLTTGAVISSTPIEGATTFVQSPDNWVIILNKAGVLEGYKAKK